jgi:hypothetical protein
VGPGAGLRGAHGAGPAARLEVDRTAANARAFAQLNAAEPVLVGLGSALDLLPGMTAETVLTSGPPMPFAEYAGGQRDAIIGAALFEGLAADREGAVAKLAAGDIQLGGCHDFGAVGSLAGVYTASMPVFEVLNKTNGNTGFCNFYEGTNPRRLNYGVYDAGVHERLQYVQEQVAPVVTAALEATEGGIPLRPLMARALHMGDELHSRNTAAALLFLREIAPPLIALAGRSSGAAAPVSDRLRWSPSGDSLSIKGQEQPLSAETVGRALEAITADHYFFLRLSMAAAKVKNTPSWHRSWANFSLL